MPTIEFTDDFNRSPSTNIGSDYNEFGAGGADMQIVSNQLKCTTRGASPRGGAFYKTALSSPDQYIQADTDNSATDNATSFIVRSNSNTGLGGDFYQVYMRAAHNDCFIAKYKSGSLSWSYEHNFSGTFDDGDNVRIEVETVSGSQVDIRVYVNDVLEATRSDTDGDRITSGDYAGVQCQAENDIWDNLEIGVLGSSSTDITDERSAKTTGKDTANSTRDAKVTGSVSVNDARGARLTGEATLSVDYFSVSFRADTNDQRSAKITGQEPTATVRSAKITGVDTASDARSAKITGSQTDNDSRSAKVTGQATTNDTRDAKVTGVDSANDIRDAKITGKTTTNDERSAKTTGTATDNDTRSAKITGSQTASDTRSSKITGTDTTNVTRSGKVTGGQATTSERSAKISGQGFSLDNDERSAKITGTGWETENPQNWYTNAPIDYQSSTESPTPSNPRDWYTKY